MRPLLMILLLLALLAAPCAANHTIAAEYDLLTGLWAWEASAARQLTGWLTIGYSLTAMCDGAMFKAGMLPSFTPIRQDYAIWAQVQHGAWSLRVTDWCNHWLAQSGRPPWADEWGLTLRVQWEW